MLINLNGVKVVLGQECKHNRFDNGITILEALVSTAIIAIGFIAIFQMVQYSIRSIDVSSERTKSGLLISMVAEDLISEKNASSPTSKVSLTDYLINQEKSGKTSWNAPSCNSGSSASQTFTNTVDVPFRFYPCLAAGLAYYLSIKNTDSEINKLFKNK